MGIFRMKYISLIFISATLFLSGIALTGCGTSGGNSSVGVSVHAGSSWGHYNHRSGHRHRRPRR